jgi:hypothetical protein
MYTTIRDELRYARKAWAGTLVDPCLLSGCNCRPLERWPLVDTGCHHSPQRPYTARGEEAPSLFFILLVLETGIRKARTQPYTVVGKLVNWVSWRRGSGTCFVLWQKLKGTVPRDFWLQAFYMDQFPPSLWLYHYGRFNFFRKFTEIFAAQGAPPVSLTPVANGKNQSEKFSLFLLNTFGY